MKPAVTPLLALFATVLLLALSAPATVTAQSSACNPQQNTCL